MVMQNRDAPNIIAVIHARGGSKRIPLKNIKPLDGKPLISYAIKAAKKSRYLRRVIVSTDHPEISRISLDYGAEVPFVRPLRLSEDCPSEWVSQHAVEFVEAEEGKKVDFVVTMQPTTPFCLSSDVDACIDIMLSNDEFNTVLSAKIIHDRPEWMFTVGDNNRAELFMEGEFKGDRGICQALPKLVMPNGGIYVTRRDTLFNEGVLISKKTGVHIMPLERSVDIDEPLDLMFAEFLASRMEIIR